MPIDVTFERPPSTSRAGNFRRRAGAKTAGPTQQLRGTLLKTGVMMGVSVTLLHVTVQQV